MTITSGLAQVGKTHLALNLALELARRGRLAGVFHDPGQIPAVDGLLDLQQPAALWRRADDSDEYGIMRRGYQGIDVLSCKMPMRLWPEVDADQRSRCTQNIDVRDGYDDFLVDTSGMDARSQLSCCRAAAVVILVVTPETRSQVESFALSRVLSLNGFAGKLGLLVNRSLNPVDSQGIFNDFSRLLKSHLDLDPVFLGGVPEDRHVTLAEHSREAFSSLFPDTDAAGGVVAVADVLDDLPADAVAGQRTVPTFLDALVDAMRAPVFLPGGEELEDAQVPAAEPDKVQSAADREQAGEMSLLQYAGGLPGLRRFLETLPPLLRSLSDDLDELVALVDSNKVFTPDAGSAELTGDQVLSLLARLLALFRAADPGRAIELEVTDMRVSGQQQSWLQVGHYLKYTFRLSQEPLPESVEALLDRIPAMTRSSGSEGEEISEVLAAARNSCLSVISTARECTRIQVWLPVVKGGLPAGVMVASR
jgi:flagellar biosynthesis protein FlhG